MKAGRAISLAHIVVFVIAPAVETFFGAFTATAASHVVRVILNSVPLEDDAVSVPAFGHGTAAQLPGLAVAKERLKEDVSLGTWRLGSERQRE